MILFFLFLIAWFIATVYCDVHVLKRWKRWAGGQPVRYVGNPTRFAVAMFALPSTTFWFTFWYYFTTRVLVHHV